MMTMCDFFLQASDHAMTHEVSGWVERVVAGSLPQSVVNLIPNFPVTDVTSKTRPHQSKVIEGNQRKPPDSRQLVLL